MARNPTMPPAASAACYGSSCARPDEAALPMFAPEALGLAGIVVDVRVTQIVKGMRGVHAFLPDKL